MRVVSFRFFVGTLFLVLAAAGPLAAQDPTFEGIWVLDLKASRNVPEAQKGVDLKVTLQGEQIAIARFTGEVPIGEPMILTLDGKSRPLKVGGKAATTNAKWLTPGKKFELTVTMPQPDGLLVTVQTIVSEVSPSGTTMTRAYTTRTAKEREERTLVYRRK